MIRGWGSAPTTEPTAPTAASETLAERNIVRVLELLESAPDGAVTITDLRERGIERPGLVLYELRMLGHVIDLVPIPGPDGDVTHGYRLLSRERPVADSP